MACFFLLVALALAQNEDEGNRDLQDSEHFELYSNFDISHLIRPEMNWYELLDIRQQLRRPSLAFYVDKVQYKTRMRNDGVDIPEIYYVQNVELDMDENALEDIQQGIKKTIEGRKDYVAKPTHMSCSDDVYVVKDGWNIYPKSPQLVQPAEVAATLTKALRTRSSLLGESWALHQVLPGVAVEERISAGGKDGTAALEFKTIVIWGRVWASDVRRGTDSVQVLGRDGRGLMDQSLHPSLAHVDWSRVRDLAERLSAHKDCFRVDIFVSPSTPYESGTAQSNHSLSLKYQVNEVEFYITSSFPLFDEAARLWLEGYNNRRYVLIPNREVIGPYADMQDPGPEEERALFAELKMKFGWADSTATSRSFGSLAPPRHEDDIEEGKFEPHRNLSAMQATGADSAAKCGGAACPW